MDTSKGQSFFDNQPIFVLDQQTLKILDVNNSATDYYGYSRDEFCGMNLSELGRRVNRQELLGYSSEDHTEEDILWIHQTKGGQERYIQFTSHVFNYDGHPAKLAVAHDVENEIKRKEKRRIKYPKFNIHNGSYPFAKVNWDSELNIKKWSPKAEELFGWTRDEIIGKGNVVKQLFPEAELAAAKHKVHTAIEHRQSHYTTEGKVITKCGDTLICKWHNSLVYDVDGSLISIYSLVTDISERRESQKLFRTLSEKSLVGVFLIQDDKFKYINPRFAEIFGYDQQQIIDAISPFDLVHPKYQAPIRQNIKERLSGTKVTKEYEVKGVTKGGHDIDISIFGSKTRYEGSPAIVGTLRDVTEDKEAMRKYQASLKTFKDLFDSISDAIYIQDHEGCFLEVNKGAEEMYGYSKEFLIGKTPSVLAAPGKVDLNETRLKTQQAIKGESQSFSWWGKRKNGEVFPKEVIMNRGSYFGEDVVITIGRDITDRYDAEEELRKNEEMFRQLFQNAPVPIVMMDKRQEIRQINASFRETFGYETEEIKGLNIDNLIVPEEAKEEAEQISASIFKGESAFYTGRRLAEDGSKLDVLIYGVPVIVNGKTIAIFGIYVDITNRKQAEEKVKKSLKEKEVLLAEIHHRVKNNLAVITGLLELQAFNTDSKIATEVLKESQMRVNSIALIHEKLYQNENLSEISFDIYLQELTGVIESSIQSEAMNISIIIEADPIEFNISQAIPCGLILNELITNAHKHAFDKQEEGKIKITITNNSGKIQLSVKDNGMGLPETVSLENPQSLGLKLIRTLSRQLKGEYSFSRNGSGTTFTLSFQLED